MSKPEEAGKKIIEALLKCKNKGVIADLKKGLVSGREFKAWPIISHHCNLEDDRMRIITQTIFGHFVSYPGGHKAGKNFGASLGLLAIRRNKNDIKRGIKLYERHLNKLFGCPTSQDVCEALGYLIRMMKGEGVHIDFESLYIDLCYWSERVRIRWAKGYLSYLTKPKEVEDVPDTDNGK